MVLWGLNEKNHLSEYFYLWHFWEYSGGHCFKENSLLVRSEADGGQGFV